MPLHINPHHTEPLGLASLIGSVEPAVRSTFNCILLGHSDIPAPVYSKVFFARCEQKLRPALHWALTTRQVKRWRRGKRRCLYWLSRSPRRPPRTASSSSSLMSRVPRGDTHCIKCRSLLRSSRRWNKQQPQQQPNKPSNNRGANLGVASPRSRRCGTTSDTYNDSEDHHSAARRQEDNAGRQR